MTEVGRSTQRREDPPTLPAGERLRAIAMAKGEVSIAELVEIILAEPLARIAALEARVEALEQRGPVTKAIGSLLREPVGGDLPAGPPPVHVNKPRGFT